MAFTSKESDKCSWWTPSVTCSDITLSTHRSRMTHICASKVDRHHDDVIKWKHFPRYWPFVRGILRSPVNSPHRGQWRGALMFTLICARINGWINNREAGDLRRHRTHYDVIVMIVSNNGLSHIRHKPLSDWTNVGLLLIGLLGTNISESWMKIFQISYKKINLKMSSAKCFCLGLNV